MTEPPRRRHIIGSLIFGCGWAIASSCPGPIATQLASGLWWSAFTILGILGGVALFFRRGERGAEREQPRDAVQSPALISYLPHR